MPTSPFAFVIGGVEKNLFDDYSINVTGWTGGGTPPITNTTIPQSLLDGAIYQRTIAQPRVIQLACVPDVPSGLMTQALMHSRRKQIISAINRDALNSSTFTLRYYGASANYSTSIDIPVYYDGGLEMDNPADSPLQPFAIRLIAVDPFWRAAADSTASLSTLSSTGTIYYLLKKSAAGVWSGIGTGVNFTVWVTAVDPSTGYVWAGGDFTTAGGTTLNRIGYWDGAAWHAVNHAGVNGTVKAIAFAGGFVYIGGSFTSSGDGAVLNLDGITAYTSDGSGGPYPFAKGVDTGTGEVRAIAPMPDGTVYVAGTFTRALDAGASPVANTAFIVKWNVSAWASIGGIGADYAVLTATIASSTAIFFGGIFDRIGSIASGAHHVAVYNPVTGAWAKLGAGVDDQVLASAKGIDGSIFFGGYFLNADGASAIRVCKWNGVGLYPLGAGVGANTNDGSYVRGMNVTADGTLYVAGIGFITAGGVSLAAPVVRWNGSGFVPEDIFPPGTPDIRGVAGDASGNLYLGFSTNGATYSPGMTTVTNGGTARAYPLFTIAASGGTGAWLRELRNYTAGKGIYLNYSLANGETLTLDLTPGKRSMRSSYYGDISSSLLPSSDVATWSLLPGANSVALTGVQYTGGALTATLTWKNRYWSAD